MKCLLCLVWMGLLGFITPSLQAGVNQSVTSGIRTTNYTGLVVLADEYTGRMPNRSVIEASFEMDFTWDTLSTTSDEYDVRFWLVDEANEVVPIYSSEGGPVMQELTDTLVLNLNAGLPQVSHVFDIALQPAERLLLTKTYTVRAKWRKRTNGGGYGGFQNVALHASAATTQTYLHFTNITSGDGVYNAVATATLDAWNRRVMIGSSDVQGSLRFTAEVTVFRYDDFNAPNLSVEVPVRLQVALKNAQGDIVWTRPSPVEVSLSVDGYQGSTLPGENPDFQTEAVPIDLALPAGILELGESYAPVVTISHDDGAGQVADGVTTFTAAPLLRLSGKLMFGAVPTRVRQVVNQVIENGSFDPPVNPTVLHSQLQIPFGLAHLESEISAVFGGNSYSVDIAPNGDATYVGGSQVAISGAGLARTQAGIRYTLAPVLNSSGGSMSVTLQFPEGCGVTTDVSMAQAQPVWTFTGQPITLNLDLPGSLQASGTALVCCCDRVPLWYATTSMSWDTSAGRIDFGSGYWYDPFINDRVALTSVFGAGQLANGNAAARPSNIAHFAYAHLDACSGISIQADAVGRATLSGRVDFTSGFLTPHFPVVGGATANQLAVIHGGHIQFAENLVTIASVLDVSDLTVAYSRKTAAAPCDGNAAPGYIAIGTPNGLRFTQDGGLAQAVTLTAPAPIKFGATQLADQFAHQLPPYTQGWFMMPGYRLAGGEAATLARDDLPAALLLSGSSDTAGTLFDYTERPDSPNYAGAGLANYAGLNVRTTSFTNGAASLIGGVPVTYRLTAASKHYVRTSGVSGVTQADVGSFSILPIPVYGGLGLDLSSYKLSFLDGINQDSLTEGGVMVGGPSQFTLLFEALKLGPTGELTTAELKAEEKTTDHRLTYWDVDFKPVEMAFRQPVSATCPMPGEGFLSVAVQARLPLTGSTPIHGVLGFKGDGDLVSQGDPLAVGTGIDSRFQLPANVPIVSSYGAYTLQPVTKAALNRWSGYSAPQTRPASGFMSFAGRLDVPFFESVKVHVHASHHPLPSKQVHLMGGWNAADVDGDGLGWAVDGRTFFNDPDFDEDHTGYPGDSSAALDAYRQPAALTDNHYRPRAMKNWYGVVNFDYPLQWQEGRLRSPTQLQNTPLVLFNLNHEVRNMSATHADLQFDAALTPGVEMPSLSLTSLLTDPDAMSLLNSALGSVGSPYDFSLLTTPVDALEGLFASTLEEALGSAMESALSPAVDLIYQQALASYNSTGGNGASFINALNAAPVQSALATSVGDAAEVLLGSGGSLAGLAASRVGQVRSQMVAFTAKMRHGGATLELVEGIVSALEDAEQHPGPAPDSSVATQILTLCDQLDAVAAKWQSLEALLSLGSSDVSQELDDVIAAQSTSLSAIAQQSLADTSSLLAMLPASAGQLFTDYSAVDMKAKIRRMLLDRFLGSVVTSEVQKIFKQHLHTLVTETSQGVDGVLGALAGAVVKRNTPPLLPGVEPTYAAGRGGLAEQIKAATLRGYAKISGDSLQELRLDGSFNLNIGGPMQSGAPDKQGMRLDAYMQVKALQSDSPTAVCSSVPGAEGLECLLGADNVPLGWTGLANGTYGYASMKFSFAESGLPQGFDGALGIHGSFGAAGMVFTDPKIIVGASPNQLYAGFSLRAEFQGKEVAAKALLGRICDINTVTQVNEGAGTLLSKLVTNAGGPAAVPAPYTGGSLYAEGWIPLNELIGIPTTCMLNLRAGAGVGMSFFVPHGADSLLIGSQQLMGLTGQVLCAITVKGTLEMNAGALVPLNAPASSQLQLQGVGNVSAKVGISPLDYTFSKSLGLQGSYNLDNGNRSFSVDF